MFGIRKKMDDEPEAVIERGVQRTGRLVVWYAKDGWRWRLWAPNGKLTAESGEAYNRRFDCVEAAKALSDRAAVARLEVANR